MGGGIVPDPDLLPRVEGGNPGKKKLYLSEERLLGWCGGGGRQGGARRNARNSIPEIGPGGGVLPLLTAGRSSSDSLTFSPSPSGIRIVPVNVSLYLSVSQQIFIESKAAGYKELGLG